MAQARLPLFYFLFSLVAPLARGAVLPLLSPEKAPPEIPGFTEQLNTASSIYVWQNDPALRDLFVVHTPDGGGATRLCLPSAISNAFLHQFAKTHPRASKLQIPGLGRAGYTVDTSVLIRTMAERCGSFSNAEGGTKMDDSLRCIRDLYRESGYSGAQVRLIRDLGTGFALEGVEYSGRSPRLSDIKSALDQGFQVIASVAFYQWNPSLRKWVRRVGHSFNLMGYAKKESQNQELRIFLQNPTVGYEMDFRNPVFDQADLVLNEGLTVRPDRASSIEVTWDTAERLRKIGMRTFLAGLILMRPN